jgi:hypothetical protein
MPSRITSTEVEQQQHDQLAAQGGVGRQAEALAHPAAGRRLGCGHGIEQVGHQAMGEQRQRQQQQARGDGGMDV